MRQRVLESPVSEHRRKRTPAIALAWLVLSSGVNGPALAGAPASTFPRPERPVARIVSPTWGDAGERDRTGEVREITARLKLRAGMTVGDIGAGDGYDSLRLARVVGPTGRVISEDVTASYLKTLASRAGTQHLGNLITVLGAPDDPRLAPASLDAAIMVHMYHEISQPFGLLYNLAPAMKPRGLIGVEELDRPTAAHGTPPTLLVCEFKAVGYTKVSMAKLPGALGYFTVFKAPDLAHRPAPGAIKPCRA